MAALTKRNMMKAICLSGLMLYSSHGMAAAFQLWEQDGASVGNYHAGYAAAAEDASIAFYNPAGLMLLKNQQIVFAGNAVFPDIIYRGTVEVSTDPDGDPTVTAQASKAALVPSFHYVAPINDVLAFGFSAVVPFGAETDYGRNNAMKYAATVSKIQVIDLSPVISIQLTDKSSIGFGPDFQIMKGEFDQMGTLNGEEYEGDGVNTASDHGWGWHAGWLYQFTSNTRLGLSYHSKVKHHLKGKSRLSGPLVNLGTDPEVSEINSDNAKVNIILPPYTALSFYHHFNQGYSLMASVIYTQWNVIKEFELQNVSIIQPSNPENSIVITNIVTPSFFKNSWNISVGGDYDLNKNTKLRAGIGYDQSPVQDRFRTVRIPGNDRYVIALGAHYQLSRVIGLDGAWSHFFIKDSRINPPTQIAGDEEVNTNGQVTSGADVFGFQLTWYVD